MLTRHGWVSRAWTFWVFFRFVMAKKPKTFADEAENDREKTQKSFERKKVLNVGWPEKLAIFFFLEVY